jgi:ketosteroid isomerase-like protein
MSEDNTQVVKDIYAAFGRGDVPAILGALSDDAQMHHAGLPGTTAWNARTYTGREQWGEFFGDLAAAQEPEVFEPEEYVAPGDRVVALGHFRFRMKATGKRYESSWAMAWTLRDGWVVDCRVYEDTESQANALSASGRA